MTTCVSVSMKYRVQLQDSQLTCKLHAVYSICYMQFHYNNDNVIGMDDEHELHAEKYFLFGEKVSTSNAAVPSTRHS